MHALRFFGMVPLLSVLLAGSPDVRAQAPERDFVVVSAEAYSDNGGYMMVLWDVDHQYLVDCQRPFGVVRRAMTYCEPLETGRKLRGYINGSKLVFQIDGKARTYHIQKSVWKPASKNEPDQPIVGTTAPPPVKAGTETSPISIKSTPDGADITVDKKYVGSTPSVIRMETGDHDIEVSKTGFKKWTRLISVRPSGRVTVDAALEKETP